VGIGKANVSEPLLKCRNVKDDIRTGDFKNFRDKPWRVPVYWPGGVRHVGGASPICCICMERGKAEADTVRLAQEWVGGREGDRRAAESVRR
jgi:hypothetical protein